MTSAGGPVTGPGLGPTTRRALAGVGMAVALLPPLLAPLAYALERGSWSAAGLGAVVGVWSLFPAVLLVGVLVRPLRDPSRPIGRTRELLVAGLVILQGFWWVLMGSGFIDRRYDEPSTARLATELRNLASQQEIHFDDVGAYGSTMTEIGLFPDDEIHVTLEATSAGWSARATHARDPSFSCAIYMGAVDRPLATGGGLVPTAPAQVVCEPPDPGPARRMLGAYYDALEIRETLGPF